MRSRLNQPVPLPPAAAPPVLLLAVALTVSLACLVDASVATVALGQSAQPRISQTVQRESINELVARLSLATRNLRSGLADLHAGAWWSAQGDLAAAAPAHLSAVSWGRESCLSRNVADRSLRYRLIGFAVRAHLANLPPPVM